MHFACNWAWSSCQKKKLFITGIGSAVCQSAESKVNANRHYEKNKTVPVNTTSGAEEQLHSFLTLAPDGGQ